MAESTAPPSGAGSGPQALQALLPVQLPDVRTLPEAQARGRACVWCAVTLNSGTAVDLGERDVDAHGSKTRWFPRGCYSCVTPFIHRALLDHSQLCEQCADNPALCETWRTLRRTLKDVRP